MGSNPQINGHRICLLDDDLSVLKSTSRLLASDGWSVQPFDNPAEFLQYAETHSPRVAVLDVIMPQMNGLEVQEQLRTRSPSTKVIMLTSKDDPSIRQRALAGGAYGFLIKPVKDDEFLASIAAVAGNGNGAREKANSATPSGPTH